MFTYPNPSQHPISSRFWVGMMCFFILLSFSFLLMVGVGVMLLYMWWNCLWAAMLGMAFLLLLICIIIYRCVMFRTMTRVGQSLENCLRMSEQLSEMCQWWHLIFRKVKKFCGLFGFPSQ